MEDETEVSLTGEGRIMDLDALLSAMEVDLDRWSVESFRANAWENQVAGGGVTQLYQVRANIRPKVPLGTAKDDVLAEIRKMSPKVGKLQRPAWAKSSAVRGRYLLEIAPVDLHLGMRAWSEITGTEHSIERAERIFLAAVRELLARAAHYPVERILFPVGHDFLHIDTLAGTTTKGTPQEVSAHIGELFRRGWKLLRAAVEEMKAMAPVTVVSVPGNHDQVGTLYVSEVLFALYENDSNVEVLSTPSPRSYFRWGETLLGLTHKPPKGERLPIIMAQEAPQDWAETSHREWHLGHVHHVRAEEEGGVRTRFLPSLCPRDEYHTMMGYQSLQAAESYLWEHDEGYSGHHSVSARSLERAA